MERWPLVEVGLYVGKTDLGKGYWDTKRKLGVTTHFSEMKKLQFGKK